MKIIRVYKPFRIDKPLRIVSYIIRQVTGSKWHHVAFMHKTNFGVDILESDFNGVVLQNYGTYGEDYQFQIIEIEINNLENEYRQNAYSKVGKVKYDFLDLPLMAYWYFTKWLLGSGRYIGKLNENRMTCYEYVAWSLNMTDWYKMQPTLFMDLCKKRNYKVVAECSKKYLHLYL